MGTESRDIAAVYVRQSHGKERSLAEQEASGRSRCEAEGWDVAGVYADKISASRFTRRERPDWARLLTDLEGARFGILWLWESSRGDRKLSTWATFLERCQEHHVRVYVETHGRLYDVRRGHDWHILAEEGTDSGYESEKTSERLRRAMKAIAMEGKPGGPGPYGFERIYDEKTKKLREVRPHLKEAPVVAEIITRIAAGEPVKAVTDSLNGRGIPSPRGGKWGREQVRRLAVNPAYIGKRRWKGHEFDAIWPPITDVGAFARAGGVLAARARAGQRPGRQKHLLSWLATCAGCGEYLGTRSGGAGQATLYACKHKGCAAILERTLDEYVIAMTAAALDSPEFWARVNATDDADVAAARAEVDTLTARRREHARLAARGKVNAEAWAEFEAEITPLIEAAERRARKTPAPGPLRELEGMGYGTLVAYFTDPSEPVAAKRDVIRAVMRTIEVRKGRRLKVADRVEITWRA